MSLLSGLIRPLAGDILVDGKSILREPMEVKRKLGVVPQDIALYPILTAVENLRFWSRLRWKSLLVQGIAMPIIMTLIISWLSVGEALLSVIGAMLEGCWWPLEIVPSFIRNFAYIKPFGWGMTGLSGAVGRGQAPAEVLVHGCVLLGMAAVFFALSVCSFGRQRA